MEKTTSLSLLSLNFRSMSVNVEESLTKKDPLDQAFSNKAFGPPWKPRSGYEQRPSLGSFAEAFTSIAKPKCHDIKYSPGKLIFAVFITTL